MNGMDIEICRAKISHLRVTETELDYTDGSLTLDPEVMDETGLRAYEKVLVINLNTGDRFETYLIEGEPGSRDVCLNGGTARLGKKEDELIVMAFARMSPEEAEGFQPTILYMTEDNRIRDRR